MSVEWVGRVWSVPFSRWRLDPTHSIHSNYKACNMCAFAICAKYCRSLFSGRLSSNFCTAHCELLRSQRVLQGNIKIITEKFYCTVHWIFEIFSHSGSLYILSRTSKQYILIKYLSRPFSVNLKKEEKCHVSIKWLFNQFYAVCPLSCSCLNNMQISTLHILALWF